MQSDGSVFSQAVQAIVESPSPDLKTAFQLMCWQESHLLWHGKQHSLNVGGEDMLRPKQLSQQP